MSKEHREGIFRKSRSFQGGDDDEEVDGVVRGTRTGLRDRRVRAEGDGDHSRRHDAGGASGEPPRRPVQDRVRRLHACTRAVAKGALGVGTDGELQAPRRWCLLL